MSVNITAACRAQISVQERSRSRLGVSKLSDGARSRRPVAQEFGSIQKLEKGTKGRTLPILALCLPLLQSLLPTRLPPERCVTLRRITRPEAVAAIRTISLPDCGTPLESPAYAAEVLVIRSVQPGLYCIHQQSFLLARKTGGM